MRGVFSSTRTNHLEGPAQRKSPPPNYTPVDCDFTDEMEYLSVSKLPVHIGFLDKNGDHVRETAKVVEVFTKNSEDYLKLDSGSIVRMDRVLYVEIVASAQ